MSLFVVTTSFPRHPDDAAGHFVLGQIRAMGLPVQVIAGGRGAWQPVPTIRYGGRLLDGMGAPDRLQADPLRASGAALETVTRLRHALRQVPRGAPIIAHWLVPCALLACRRGPTLAIAHGGDVALLERLPGGRHLARHLDTHCAAIGFVSADLRCRFEALAGPARCPHPLLPMGIAPPRPDPDFAQRLQDEAAGRSIIATIGRRVPIKGLDVLDAALAGWRGVWFAAGDGPVQPQRARLLGSLAPPQRDALLAVAQVVVVPSRRLGTRVEGTPLSVLEALQSGATTVVTRTGGMAGLPHTVQVPPDQPDALRAAIDTALRAPRPDRNRAEHAAWAVIGRDHRRWARWLLRSAGQAAPKVS